MDKTYARGTPKIIAKKVVVMAERMLSSKAVRMRSFPKAAATSLNDPSAATYWYKM